MVSSSAFGEQESGNIESTALCSQLKGPPAEVVSRSHRFSVGRHTFDSRRKTDSLPRRSPGEALPAQNFHSL